MISSEKKLRYYSAFDTDFVLDGLYFDNGKECFLRLPQKAFVSEIVHELASNTAGVMLRFRTDSESIGIRVKLGLTRDSRADHMAQTGTGGFDLYRGTSCGKTFVGVSRFPEGATQYSATLFFQPNPEKKMFEYTLHFPLYCSVESFELILEEDARKEKPSAWKDPRPVVVYGTSIQQGGCASRPGMCHTHQMSRLLDRPFLNFGFSGGAKGETEIAQILASIENPAMYILDYDANAGVKGLESTLSGFIDILRSAHAETPILLVSKTPYGKEFTGETSALLERHELTRIHQTEWAKRRKAGDQAIHFLDGRTLYGPDGSECTVDGAHATDLGFYFIARSMAPVIERILSSF